MPKTPTPEEIEAMRKAVAEHDAKLAEERRQQQLAAIQPLLDIVNSESFQAMEGHLAKLFALAADIEPIRVHVGALQAGMTNLRNFTDGLQGSMFVPMPASAAVIDQSPSAEA